MKKKFIIAISVVLVLALLIGIDSIYNSQRFDYLRIEEIPKGYVEYDGKVDAGKDYDHLFWYRYDKKPKLCNDYQLVEDNEKTVKKAFNIYADYKDVSLENLVTADDYFILKSFDGDANEIYFDDGEFNEENWRLYFFDTQTNTLYHCRWIW